MEPVRRTLDQSTHLALQRSFLATERTLMAWIRTSISMIGFGFTVAKLFQSLASSNVLIRGPAGEVWTAEGVGMLMVSLGTFALVAAVFDHRRELNQLRDCRIGNAVQPNDGGGIGAGDSWPLALGFTDGESLSRRPVARK